MKILILLTILPTIFGEAPYEASGWRPQGQPFNLPQRPQQQYGAPLNQQQLNNLYNAPQNVQNLQNQLNGGYRAPQINNQYGAPQQNAGYPLRNQVGVLQSQQNLNNQYSAAQNQQNGGYPLRNQIGSLQNQQELSNQYIPPQNQINNQYGAPGNNGYPQPQNNYIPPSVDPLRTQFPPNQQSNSNFNPQNTSPPGRTYLSQTPNPINNPQTSPSQQFGQLRQQASSQNQDIELLSQNSLPRETNESEESNQDQLNNQEDENQERGYTKRRKQPRRNERTTERPSTTESPDNDGDNSDQPNVAISTAVAGASSTGQYYILLPDGKLQRVVYMTSPDSDDKSTAVVANLMYELVEPLKGPIYQYVGNELVRIN